MKKLPQIRFLVIVGTVLLFGSWSSMPPTKAIVLSGECTMDVYAENNTPVTVEYVKFISSIETETLSNIPGSGGNSSAAFTWETTEGFLITVKLGNSARPSRIRIYRGNLQTLVLCTIVNSPTIPITFDIQPSQTCDEAYFVIIDSSSC